MVLVLVDGGFFTHTSLGFRKRVSKGCELVETLSVFNLVTLDLLDTLVRVAGERSGK